ncbi:phage DNA packaging protein J [Streptomyces galbus]
MSAITRSGRRCGRPRPVRGTRILSNRACAHMPS